MNDLATTQPFSTQRKAASRKYDARPDIPLKQAKQPPIQRKVHDELKPITPEEYNKLHNAATDEEVNVLLAPSISASGVTNKHLNTISSWELNVDLRPVRFSARFSALWVRHHDSMVWFCVVEDEFLAFRLRDGGAFEIEKPDDHIPQITLPRRGIRWTTLQQALVDHFDDDNHVRAIAAAAMVCTKPTGKFATVANELLPAELRELESRLNYDTPMDEDMMTVLSDPKSTNKGTVMYFDCGAGYCAESTVNESIGRLSKITKPLFSTPFVESSAMLLPFVFN